MPAADDRQFGGLGHCGPHVAAVHRHPGEAREHVDRGARLRHRLQLRHVAQHQRAQFGEQLLFQRDGPLLRGENAVFVFLQFGRDEPFGVGQRLFAHVAVGHLRHVGLGDLQVIAEYAIVADLERGDAGLFALARLQLGEPLLGVAGQGMQLVQRGRIPRGDHAAVAQVGRRRIDQRPPQAVGQRGEVCGEGGALLAQQRAAQRRERLYRGRNPRQRVAQRRGVLGRRHPATETRGQAFEVAYRGEARTDRFQRGRRVDEFLHRGVPFGDRRYGQQRIAQPRLQQPAAHRRDRLVQHVEQGLAPQVGIGRPKEFQAALDHRTELHRLAGPAAFGQPDVRQGSAHVPFQEAQHERRGRGRLGIQFQGAQRVQAVEIADARQAVVLARPPIVQAGDRGLRMVAAVARDDAVLGQRLGRHDFVGGEPVQRVAERGLVLVPEPEAAGRRLHHRQPPPLAAREQPEQRRAGRVGLVFDVGGRGDDTRDLALDQSPGGLGVFDLFAERDFLAELDQPRDVAVHRVVRHPAHRYLAAPAVARRQRQVEPLRHARRVVEENLVEIAQPEQDDRVLVLLLDREVLLHQRRQSHEALLRGAGVAGSTREESGCAPLISFRAAGQPDARPAGRS